MDYKKIDDHMKGKFSSTNKIEEIPSLSDYEIDKITDNKIYKTRMSVVAIDIIDSVKLNEKLSVDNYNKIISEFAFGVSSILKDYGGLWITIQGDMIYAIFKADTRDKMDDVFNAACELNSFMQHLNKNIKKSLQTDKIVEAGIGVWFGFENYITKVGKSGDRDIVFMGDSVNKACKLANLAGRGNYSNILFNELLKTNFTEKMKAENIKIGSFTSYRVSEFKEVINGCGWVMTTYTNFIKNNV